MAETIESGVPGLDELFFGGFPRGKMILVTGPPGSGKTVLTMQFLISGAISDEPAVYVAFDDLPRHVRNDMKSFGWPIAELEKIDPPLLTIVDGFSSRVGLSTSERFQIRANVDSLLITLDEVLNETGATRVVVDSLTTLSSEVKTPGQVRKEILTMGAILGDRGCTTMLTAEVGGYSSGTGQLAASTDARFSPEEYSAQGCLALRYEEVESGEFQRYILVQKMRGHRHLFGWKELEITSKGIVIHWDKALG